MVDAIFHSGRIRTLDAANPEAEAVAVADGKFAAVGDARSVPSTCSRVCDETLNEPVRNVRPAAKSTVPPPAAPHSATAARTAAVSYTSPVPAAP